MNISLFERHFFHDVHTHHHHPGNPEENDVKTGNENRSRIESVQIFAFVRPAQSRKSPQAGRKPGVEHVGFARQLNPGSVMPVGRRLRFLFVFLAEYLAVGTVPNRHLVSPPQLAGNAPRLNVAHPFEISFLVRLRHKLHFSVFNRANRLFGQRRRVNEPLVGQHRFDHDVGTVAVRDNHRVIFDFFHKAQFFQFGNGRLARALSIHAGKRRILV